VIDVLSHGFGLGDPPSTAGATAGAVPPFTYTENNRTWGAAPAIPVENLADVTLTNIASARIDLARAALDPAATLTLPTTSDGDAVLTLDGAFPPGRVAYEDGVVLPGGSAGAGGAVVPVASGSHTYVIAAAPTCGLTPLSGCRTPIEPRRALLQLRNTTPDTKDRLLWKWTHGAATTVADFGNPLSTTGYGLCIYDGNNTRLQAAAAPAGGLCNATRARACWRATAKGYRYADRDLTPAGVRRIILQSGAAGNAKIVVKGQGALLAPPALPIEHLPVRVQLVSSDGVCWEATYGSTVQNLSDRFKAKSD